MAEMPGPIVVVNLCRKKADASGELGYTVDVLVASIAEGDTVRGRCIFDEGTIMGTELCNVRVSSRAKVWGVVASDGRIAWSEGGAQGCLDD